MRYSYEFKRKCVEMYHQGKWPPTPDGIKQHNFRVMVKRWVLMEDSQGPEVLKHKDRNKVWTPDEKLSLVAQVLAGKSNQKVAIEAGINIATLHQWVQKYQTKGYDGLVGKKGHLPKEIKMKKDTKPMPLTESEREELIRLRAEIEYIKAENEVIKKEIALREEKQAALLKAKKQQSLKNFAKKGIN